MGLYLLSKEEIKMGHDVPPRMTWQKKSDAEKIQEAEPVIRTVVAFLIYLCKPAEIEEAYKKADSFIARLHQDLSK